MLSWEAGGWVVLGSRGCQSALWRPTFSRSSSSPSHMPLFLPPPPSLESMLPLLPSAVQGQVHMLIPSRKFDLSYDLNCASLCSDFQENIEFQFSLGWSALVHRFLGTVNAQRALKLMDQSLQVGRAVTVTQWTSWRGGSRGLEQKSNQPFSPPNPPQPSRPALMAPTPSSGPSSISAPPNNETALMSQEDLMMAMVTNVASLTSRTSMSVVVVGGVVS